MSNIKIIYDDPKTSSTSQPTSEATLAPARGYEALTRDVRTAIEKLKKSHETGWMHHSKDALEILEKAVGDASAS